MKQGSILSYLHRATVAPIDEDLSAQKQPPTTLDVLANEKAAIIVTESQDIKIDANVGTHDTSDNSSTARVLHVKLSDPRVSISKIFPSHVERLKSITSTLLPVRYSDRFFAECLDSENGSVLSYTSLFDSKPVGWIRCRLEPLPNSEEPVYQQIYIQALGVLAPYRGMGLASALLDAVMSSRTGVRGIYAHVWETNEDALEWYERHGFRRILLVPQYYRKLVPSGAWIVRRDLS